MQVYFSFRSPWKHGAPSLLGLPRGESQTGHAHVSTSAGFDTAPPRPLPNTPAGRQPHQLSSGRAQGPSLWSPLWNVFSHCWSGAPGGLLPHQLKNGRPNFVRRRAAAACPARPVGLSSPPGGPSPQAKPRGRSVEGRGVGRPFPQHGHPPLVPPLSGRGAGGPPLRRALDADARGVAPADQEVPAEVPEVVERLDAVQAEVGGAARSGAALHAICKGAAGGQHLARGRRNGGGGGQSG